MDLYTATIGFVILLFLLMGVFIYHVSLGLNREDAEKIDPLPPDPADDTNEEINS